MTNLPEDSCPYGPSETQQVLIDRLVLDPEFQVRTKLDDQAIRRYAAMYEAGRNLDPIKVADVSGVLIVTDGWHRIEALKRIGRPHVMAVVTEMSREEARWQAATANTTHGVPVKRSELVNVFKLYVRSGKHIKGRGRGGHVRYRSYREMQAELPFPVSHGTIRNWMFKHFPKIARAIGDNDVPLASGGLREAAGEPHSAGAQKLAGELLDHFQSLSSHDARKEVVFTVRKLLARLEVAAGYPEEPKPEF
jgi:hypothetical protein